MVDHEQRKEDNRWTPDTLFWHFTKILEEKEKAVQAALAAQQANNRFMMGICTIIISMATIVAMVFRRG